MQNQTAALAAGGRVLIAILFLLSGLGKIAAPAMTLGYIASAGLPAPLLGYLIAIQDCDEQTDRRDTVYFSLAGVPLSATQLGSLRSYHAEDWSHSSGFEAKENVTHDNYSGPQQQHSRRWIRIQDTGRGCCPPPYACEPGRDDHPS